MKTNKPQFDRMVTSEGVIWDIIKNPYNTTSYKLNNNVSFKFGILDFSTTTPTYLTLEEVNHPTNESTT